jgi:hypothetical protein
MSLFKIAGLLLCILILVSVCLPQRKNNFEKWLKIKIFDASREDVEKLYGKGKIYQNKYFVIYKTLDETISVDYSLGGCERQYAIWNVPEWRVTEISYSFGKNSPKLNDLISNKKQFKKRQFGDVINQIEYYDEERGIKILYDNLEKKVYEIIILPSKKYLEKYQCK